MATRLKETYDKEVFKALMDKVQSIVEERAGVRLEPEIRILGEEENA